MIYVYLQAIFNKHVHVYSTWITINRLTVINKKRTADQVFIVINTNINITQHTSTIQNIQIIHRYINDTL